MRAMVQTIFTEGMIVARSLKLTFVLMLMTTLAACATQPSQSAYSRNVGAGSSVTGKPESDLGSAASGNDYVPGAPAAGGIGGNGGSR